MWGVWFVGGPSRLLGVSKDWRVWGCDEKTIRGDPVVGILSMYFPDKMSGAAQSKIATLFVLMGGIYYREAPNPLKKPPP